MSSSNGKAKAKTRVIPLTPGETEALAEHELTIGQGLKAFIAVGLALLAIRDGKLYRAEHKTFEAYLADRWGISRSRGYQLIEAAEVARDLSTSGGHGLEIENERQARALAMVPPHLREEVLQHIKDADDELTEQSVTKAVNALLEQKRLEAKEREQSGEEEEEEPEQDAQSDEEADSGEQETESDRTIKRTAKKHAKDRLYLARGLEHLRLAVKDLKKVRAMDLETPEARQAAREGLDAADAVFSDVRGWLQDDNEAEAA